MPLLDIILVLLMLRPSRDAQTSLFPTKSWLGAGYTILGTINGCYIRNYYRGSTDNTVTLHAFYVSGTTCELCITDSDGDGIPNTVDLYPDDPDPYNVSIISVIEDSNGDIVQYTVKTDRGDIFYYGDRPEDMTDYQDVVYINPMSLPGEDVASIFEDGGLSVSDTTGSTSDIFDVITDTIANPSDAGSGISSGFDSGTDYDTGDSDTNLLQKIVTNTKNSTDNISRLGDYLQAINGTLQGISTKQTVQNSTGIGTSTTGVGSGTIDLGTITETEEATSLGNAGNVDTEYGTAVSSITGTASLEDDAPEEFRTKTNISDYLTDLIDNSPIQSILSGTVITTTGATPEITWTYNGQSLPLTVAGFEDELDAFGAILIAMVTITGLIMIFRG